MPLLRTAAIGGLPIALAATIAGAPSAGAVQPSPATAVVAVSHPRASLLTTQATVANAWVPADTRAEIAAANRAARAEVVAANRAARAHAAAVAAANRAARTKRAADVAAANRAARAYAQAVAVANRAARTRAQAASASVTAYSCRAANISNLPGLKPWPQKVRKMVAAKFGIRNIGGYRPGSGSDHNVGLALDVMTMRNRALGDRVAAWATANYRKLNLKYVIWKQRIWMPGRGWRPMADRGSITANHFDHPHLSFNSGSGRC